MKFKSIRKLEESIARNVTPQASVTLGLLALAIVLFGILLAGCAATPESIREESARINAQIDGAQADANQTIDEQLALAEAAKEAAQAIRDNIKESVDDVTENIKDSIDEVAK